ncbi:hypothetical protein HF251_13975 [Rhizobium leguminosarum]|uniref:hypothetical protein n=1 Tax=Rhizobium leguminosarum TaxID=384 RepID=UPI0012F85875|nr:hypothetical protein [Rhizobium leguminosarum]MBY2963793.1 hypothetical protein [Rhizobium leguminosarum]
MYRVSMIALMMVSALVFPQSGARASRNVPIPIPRPAQMDATPDIGQASRSASTSPVLLSGTRLTLEDAVFLGLRNNRTIRSAYIDRASEKFGLLVAEDRFNPQFGISGNVSRKRIGGVESSTVEVSPGISLLTTTGAAIDFAWNTTANWQDTQTTRGAVL